MTALDPKLEQKLLVTLAMTPMRSAIRSATSRMWVVRMTVPPAFTRCSSTSFT